ncbi:hypothetical protein GCM10023085_11440 [Actinomadura viridis]|uniref:Uncharacterized protein n=1 Tax=Actinomadura viridis TaxID=58110 RepID=A0A931DP49_9ACTN|nr:hypothetical protein [Actinomadura viridis]MBG6093520.1 hypothetical protein [Actinomadura viridis]
MAPTESEHSPEKMRQVARAMQAELEKLRAGASGHPTTVGTIGAWDVPTDLGRRIDTAHQSMITYVTEFVDIYARLVSDIQRSAKYFDLSELASRQAAGRAGGLLDPPATRDSQN